mgnify:CR=1 FL=1
MGATLRRGRWAAAAAARACGRSTGKAFLGAPRTRRVRCAPPPLPFPLTLTLLYCTLGALRPGAPRGPIAARAPDGAAWLHATRSARALRPSRAHCVLRGGGGPPALDYHDGTVSRDV